MTDRNMVERFQGFSDELISQMQFTPLAVRMQTTLMRHSSEEYMRDLSKKGVAKDEILRLKDLHRFAEIDKIEAKEPHKAWSLRQIARAWIPVQVDFIREIKEARSITEFPQVLTGQVVLKNANYIGLARDIGTPLQYFVSPEKNKAYEEREADRYLVFIDNEAFTTQTVGRFLIKRGDDYKVLLVISDESYPAFYHVGGMSLWNGEDAMYTLFSNLLLYLFNKKEEVIGFLPITGVEKDSLATEILKKRGPNGDSSGDLVGLPKGPSYRPPTTEELVPAEKEYINV